MPKKIETKGDLIISSPQIFDDLNFNRSVILLAEHNKQGSVGFVLNKPLKIKLKDIIPNTNCNFKIFFGGPVESENLYFIHTIPEIVTNSIEISNGIYWGGDFTNILNLLEQEKISKEQIRFFLGYTGWDYDQLKEEIQMESWLVKENIHTNKLLKKTPSTLWKELMKSFGDKELIWSNAPEDPIMN